MDKYHKYESFQYLGQLIMGKVIATVMAMLMLAITCMSMTLLMLPILQKVKIEQTIRDYTYEANQANGFAIEKREALVKALSQQGLKEIQLKVPLLGDLERFESREISVEGKLSVKKFGSWLYIYEETLPFQYKGKVYGKRILN